ncbi:hypothetical protein P7K49_017012 [Saguinus oedipus]|uniref:Uncharacterized protein n=1 Tax=Saguinus oedipus TaxID=9490 RepID=A0ABQ9V1P1_SAGOE|nr:hypothetical protein P7K49_017012 [Saguinus oedipus]
MQYLQGGLGKLTESIDVVYSEHSNMEFKTGSTDSTQRKKEQWQAATCYLRNEEEDIEQSTLFRPWLKPHSEASSRTGLGKKAQPAPEGRILLH